MQALRAEGKVWNNQDSAAFADAGPRRATRLPRPLCAAEVAKYTSGGPSRSTGFPAVQTIEPLSIKWSS